MLRDPHRKKKIIALLWLDTESWVADTSRNFSELFQDIEIKFSPLLSLAASNFDKFLTQKMTEQTINSDNRYGWRFDQFSTIKVNRTFPGMFRYIPRNVWRYSPECLTAFPGMFGYISRNVWRHSPEYNIPPIPRVPFPVPVFLVLYIAGIFL